jgi:hypothetical protein
MFYNFEDKSIIFDWLDLNLRNKDSFIIDVDSIMRYYLAFNSDSIKDIYISAPVEINSMNFIFYKEYLSKDTVIYESKIGKRLKLDTIEELLDNNYINIYDIYDSQ